MFDQRVTLPRWSRKMSGHPLSRRNLRRPTPKHSESLRRRTTRTLDAEQKITHGFSTMGGPDRTGNRDGPTLGAQVLIRAIEELPFYKGLVNARIAHKKNHKGEHVVAVIFPPQPP